VPKTTPIRATGSACFGHPAPNLGFEKPPKRNDLRMRAPGDVLSYLEMCQDEGSSLQQGMNFRLRGGASVILMRLRRREDEAGLAAPRRQG
jgi:hypothetical protein